MSSSHKNLSDYSNKNLTDMAKKRFAIVVSEWNSEVTEALYSGAFQTLQKMHKLLKTPNKYNHKTSIYYVPQNNAENKEC